MTKQYSYQDYPVVSQILILGIDVTTYKSVSLSEIGSIEQDLDYPNITEYKVGDMSFILNDPEGLFSVNNPDNFFVQNSWNQTGNHAEVEIKAGFSVNGVKEVESIFVGNIVRVHQGARKGTVEIDCVDRLQPLTFDEIKDFGIQRDFMINHNPIRTSANGEYLILKALLPPSDESEHLYTAANREGTTLVDELATEGFANPLRYTFTDIGIETEGGIIQNRGVGFPQVAMKSPFRYKDIRDIISSILDKYSITMSDVEILTEEVNMYFSSNGRVGYDVIATQELGSSNPSGWLGHVTDVLYDDNKFYFLYNVKSLYRSMIIEYDNLTREFDIIHRASAAGIEYWKFAKNSDVFAIMARTNGQTQDENYDSISSQCDTHIIQWDSSTDTVSSLVSATSLKQPQLAHFYGLGSANFESPNQDTRMLPDTRRSMQYHGDDLYYGFVDTLSGICGVAKKIGGGGIESVVSWEMDGAENHAGISFDIVGDTLKGSASFNAQNYSIVKCFIKSI